MKQLSPTEKSRLKKENAALRDSAAASTFPAISNATEKSLPPPVDASAESLPPSLQFFDQLPDSAFVRQPVVKIIFGRSNASVWRDVASGRLPKPVKLGPRAVGWNVGALRKVLAARTADDAE